MKHGTEQQNFETGAKRDTQADKIRYDLVTPFGLKRLAQVYTDGAKHYGDRNWEKGIPIARCFASLERHVQAYKLGDKSEDHMAQAAWNAFTILHNEEMIERGVLPLSLADMPDYRPVAGECNGKAPIVFPDELDLHSSTSGNITVTGPTDEDLAEALKAMTYFSALTPNSHPLDGYYTSFDEGGLEGYGLLVVRNSRSTWYEPDFTLTPGLPVDQIITEDEFNLITFGLLDKAELSTDPIPHLSPAEAEKLESRVKAGLDAIFNNTTNDHIDLREGVVAVGGETQFGTQDDLDRITADMMRLGCPIEVATQIVGGITFPATLQVKGWVYVAGPMRGLPSFNFPSFDVTRDRMLEKGFVVISPADIDRATNANADDTTQDVSDQTAFAMRDFWSLYFIRTMNPQTGSIALLPGWERSTGASAEFFVSRWLGLKILNAFGDTYVGSPLEDFVYSND